jgi:hypothetical protein
MRKMNENDGQGLSANINTDDVIRLVVRFITEAISMPRTWVFGIETCAMVRGLVSNANDVMIMYLALANECSIPCVIDVGAKLAEFVIDLTGILIAIVYHIILTGP